MKRQTIITALGAAALLIAGLAPVAGAAAPAGALYIASNQAAGNEILVYARGADGSLTAADHVATGGNGTGAGLGSQGAVTLSDDGAWLFTVNAASNSVSTFKTDGTAVALTDVEPSNGIRPTSVTAHGNLVYVLNAGGDGNIAGFRRQGGNLSPIAGSVRPLSSTTANAGQITFSPDGKFLVVAERGSRRMAAYPVTNGVAGSPTVLTAPGITPFGFAFTVNRTLIVSEAATGSASSYSLTPKGGFELVEGAVPDFQGAPCWFVATADGTLAYTTNAASGSISAFTIAPSGDIELLGSNGIVATFGPGTAPTDEAIAGGDEFLYANVSAAHRIAIFSIAADGSLGSLGSLDNLPTGAVGLATI